MKKDSKESNRIFLLSLKKKNLESLKIHLDRIVDTLVEFAFTDVAHYAVGFDELWSNELHLCNETIRQSNLPDDVKINLGHEVLPIFPSKEDVEEKKRLKLTNEEWRVKKDIEYVEKRIRVAEQILNHLPTPVKKKIVKEGITKRIMWHDCIRAYGKIQKAIKEHKPKKKVVKKTKSKPNKKKK